MAGNARIDDIRRSIIQAVRRHGWSVQMVLPGLQEPSFAYTVGLTEIFGHPEFLMIGFDPHMMHRLINDTGELVRNGRQFEDWDQSDQVIRDFPVYFRELPLSQARKWARAASERYRPKSFRLLQIFLPDPAGLFPWDQKCDTHFAKQAQFTEYLTFRH